MEKNPELRFKGFSADWQSVTFASLAETKRGLTYKPSSIREKGVRVLRSSNIQEDRFVISDDDVFVEKDAINIDYAQNGDILITSANGSQRLVGKHCILKGLEDGQAVHGGFMLLARSRHPFFLNASMSSEWYATFIKLFVAGGSGAIGNLNKNDLDSQLLFVPNEREQETIGEFYEVIDKLIEEKQEGLRRLKRLYNSLLRQMFPQGDSCVPEVRFRGFSNDWIRKPLGEMGDTFNGLSGKTKEDFGHGAAKYVTYMNVFSNVIAKLSGVDSIERDQNQYQLHYGDVLFTTSSETPDEVGMSSVWLGTEEHVYLNSFCFGYRPHEKFYPYYLAYALRSPRIRKCFYLLAQGISRFNISKQKAMDIELDVPSYDEQKKIGDFLHEQDVLIEASAEQLKKLVILKQALLSKMFV